MGLYPSIRGSCGHHQQSCLTLCAIIRVTVANHEASYSEAKQKRSIIIHKRRSRSIQQPRMRLSQVTVWVHNAFFMFSFMGVVAFAAEVIFSLSHWRELNDSRLLRDFQKSNSTLGPLLHVSIKIHPSNYPPHSNLNDGTLLSWFNKCFFSVRYIDHIKVEYNVRPFLSLRSSKRLIWSCISVSIRNCVSIGEDM